MIVPQHSAEPLATLYRVPRIDICRRRTRDKSVPEPLVVPLEMVMLDILSDHVSKVPLTERHNSVEALDST